MKQKEGVKTSTKLLIFTTLLYLLIALFDFSFAKESFFNFLSMLTRIIPILGVVFVIMTFTDIYFTKERANKYLGAKSGARGWLYAIISGIIISGPPYILYPLLGELKEKGMKNSLLATFLFNRNVKIPFIPVMVLYFGLSFTVIISFYIILFSVFNGIVVSWFLSKKL